MVQYFYEQVTDFYHIALWERHFGAQQCLMLLAGTGTYQLYDNGDSGTIVTRSGKDHTRIMLRHVRLQQFAQSNTPTRSHDPEEVQQQAIDMGFITEDGSDPATRT